MNLSVFPSDTFFHNYFIEIFGYRRYFSQRLSVIAIRLFVIGYRAHHCEYLPELLKLVSGILFCVFSFVMAYNNKKLVQYVDVILLFVSKISTFDSLNFRYFEKLGFIRTDFMCFSNVVVLEIYSVFPKQKCVFCFVDYL